ncbi:MAG TPA: glycosyltransferase [Chloroflexia bacterium]|nr:glycosyltransferase [Chloroflexia bacterium]
MSPPVLLLVYQAVVLLFLLALLVLLAINMAVLPNIRAYRRPDAAPFVSVLVPARDEAAQIAACIRGLLAQDYPAFEVIALDDDSTDATGAILAALAAGDARLRVLAGEPLRPGWLGKANACRQLAAAARGELLLFTDADVRHAPALLGHAVGLLRAQGAGLLSIFPTQVTGTWAERLVVPILQHFAVYVLLPLPLMQRLRAPAFAAANGQFLLFERRAYVACGGHGAVRTAVLEDVALARAVKAAGYRIALADGNGLVACRMYCNRAEVVAGFAKNLFAFFNGSWLFLAAGLAVGLGLWVLPPLWVGVALPGALAPAAGPADRALAGLPLAQYGVAVLTRLWLARRFGSRPADALLHPLSLALVLALALHSARLSRRGGAIWKGRAV